MIEHSEQCEKTKLRWEVWFAQWPNHCKTCGAWGSYTIPATRLDPPDGGPCPKCTEQGICPRCASTDTRLIEYQSGDYLICDNCGWDEWPIVNNDERASDMVCPDFECLCEFDPKNHEFVSYDGSDCLVCGLESH